MRHLIDGDPQERYGRRATVTSIHKDAYGSRTRTKSLAAKPASKEDHGHGVTFVAALHCVQAKWTLRDFTEVMTDTNVRAGNHVKNLVRLRGYLKAEIYLRRVWRSASEKLAKNPHFWQDDAREYLLKLRVKAALRPWPGLRGQSALKALLAHFAAAMRCGSARHTLSMRECAELGGMDKNTASRARELLKELGWLRNLGRGEDPSEAATWVLSAPSHHSPTSVGRQAGGASVWVNGETAQLDEQLMTVLQPLDAFAHRGMGGSGAKVVSALYQALQDGESLSLTDLHTRASMSRATGARKLKTLVELELVAREEGQYRLSDAGVTAMDRARLQAEGWAQDWDWIADYLGVAGTGRRRRARHAIERASFAEWMKVRTENRAKDVTPDRGDRVPEHWSPGDQIWNPRQRCWQDSEDLVVDSTGTVAFLSEEPTYDELVAMNRNALNSYSEAA